MISKEKMIEYFSRLVILPYLSVRVPVYLMSDFGGFIRNVGKYSIWPYRTPCMADFFYARDTDGGKHMAYFVQV